MLLKEKQSHSRLADPPERGSKMKAHSSSIINSYHPTLKGPISNKFNEIKLIGLEFYKKLSTATKHQSVMYNKNTNRTKRSKFGILLRRMSNCAGKLRPLTPSNIPESKQATLPITHQRKIVYLKVK